MSQPLTSLGTPLLDPNVITQTDQANDALKDEEDKNNASVDLTITTDYDLSAIDFRKYFNFHLTGSPGAAFEFRVPAVPRQFRVKNDTGQTATVQVQGAASPPTSVNVTNGNSAMLYSDGVDVESA